MCFQMREIEKERERKTLREVNRRRIRAKQKDESDPEFIFGGIVIDAAVTMRKTTTHKTRLTDWLVALFC